MSKKIFNKTRKIYFKLHKNYFKNKNLFNRFYDYALNPKNYCLEKKFFKNVLILDAGCGNTGYFPKAMIDLGAKHIYCLDLGKNWIKQLKKDLKKKNVSLSKITCISGSITKIPLENSKFDFVACNGVIYLLPNVNSATKTLKELLRVTKPGGSIFAYFGTELPGIFEKYIVPALRKAYLEEKKFKKIIDQGNPMYWQKNLKAIAKIFYKNDNSISYLSILKFIKLITLETTTFMQDCLQVPIYQGLKLDKKYAFKTLKKIGAQNIRSPKDFYFKRKDVRKFLTPFHVSKKTNSLSKILYGEHLKFTFDKPNN